MVGVGMPSDLARRNFGRRVRSGLFVLQSTIREHRLSPFRTGLLFRRFVAIDRAAHRAANRHAARTSDHLSVRRIVHTFLERSDADHQFIAAIAARQCNDSRRAPTRIRALEPRSSNSPRVTRRRDHRAFVLSRLTASIGIGSGPKSENP
jgi:hypothetical protein